MGWSDNAMWEWGTIIVVVVVIIIIIGGNNANTPGIPVANKKGKRATDADADGGGSANLVRFDRACRGLRTKRQR